MKKYIILIVLSLVCWVGIHAQTPKKVTYTYDALNRLTEVTYPNGEKITYNYDVLGNRTSVVQTGCTATPTAVISGGGTINIGETADLIITFTGIAPYNFTLSSGSSGTAFGSPYTLRTGPTVTTTYTLASVSNQCGTGTVSGSAVVTVNGSSPCPPTITHSGNIASGTYSASGTIVSTANVPNNTKYYAGQSVTLSQGFSAGPGENFEIKIQGCNTTPTAQTPRPRID
ncbi:RHS repeat domain-containing protein [Runella limosa]|uniref:RHS repeat domain-containing protein n=1 Tax=Runella limosa TaxID=370978 RepID=UPI000405033D|nr:RHS repeat domain-containing protein [Runella limosa]